MVGDRSFAPEIGLRLAGMTLMENILMTQENPEHRLSTGEYHPWRIMILLSNAQNECIATFRNRPDAEHYLRSIRRLAPQYHYELVFHPPELEEVQE